MTIEQLRDFFRPRLPLEMAWNPGVAERVCDCLPAHEWHGLVKEVLAFYVAHPTVENRVMARDAFDSLPEQQRVKIRLQLAKQEEKTQ